MSQEVVYFPSNGVSANAINALAYIFIVSKSEMQNSQKQEELAKNAYLLF